MDYHPFPWAMVRVWLLLLSVAALFVGRALVAWLFRTWQRRRAARSASRRPHSMQERRDTVAGRLR